MWVWALEIDCTTEMAAAILSAAWTLKQNMYAPLAVPRKPILAFSLGTGTGERIK